MSRSLPAWRAFALVPLAAAFACGPTSGPSAPPDPFESESRGGKLHNVEVPNFDVASFNAAPSASALTALFAATAADTGQALRGLAVNDFVVVSSSTEVTAAGARLAHVRLRQEVDGIPVWGTHLSMTARAADARGAAKLLASSHHVYSGIKAAITPDVSEATAAGLAFTADRTAAAPVVTDTKLVLWPLKGSLDLVWSIQLEGSHFRSLVYATGDLKGRVLRRDLRYYETTGTVTAPVAVGGAPGGNGVTTETAMPRLDVTGSGIVATTGESGQYVIDVQEGSIVTAALAGLAVSQVSDQSGLATSVSATAAAVTDLLIGDPANVLAVANGSAYFYTDKVLDFLLANGVNDPALFDLVINSNISDSCNAFFTGNTINFFQSGGGCNNTAEETIIAHEYGHFVDAVFGGITDGGLSEGWGDLLSCLMTKTPGVGPDFFVGDGTPLRTCDNQYQFPISGQDQVHELGQAWAGFGWHAREGLIAALGEEEGDALARALLLPSFPSNAADIPAAVRETFIRDDDDGNLENLTPHWDILLAAAELHSLAFIVDEDLVAPAAVNDLTVASVSATKVELTWTATGDDNNEGQADFYDVRKSSAPITATNFAQAQPIAGPVPLPAGGAQTLDASLAPGETAFFALRVFDEQGNGSGISNVVEVTADEGAIVFQDSFENGAAGWETTGLWHVTERKASDGAKSFWYGDEATGNYNTGAANAGELLSPPIDLAGAINPVLVFANEFDVEATDIFDVMTITAFDVNDPTIEISVKELDGVSGGFRSRVLALDGFTDRTVRVRFSFDTIDSILNDTEGWFIDDFRIVAENTAVAPTLIINEILADPGSFDANNDGAISFRDDEFVELLNIGDDDIDLSGVTISDALRVRFTFPAGASIAAGTAVVVFGGGSPNIGAPSFTGGTLALNNNGDTVTVRAADGAELDTVTYGVEAGDNQSVTRAVDGSSEAAFVKHTTLSAKVASPGTRVDGSPFGEVPGTGAILMINEILSDPGSIIDANGDGIVSSTQDEFVELANIGDAAADLSGGTFSDLVGVRLTFPVGTIVPAGGVLVIFGGGSPVDIGVPVVKGTGSLFLNNSGDDITIRDSSGQVVAAAKFGTSNDHSLNRAIDLAPGASFVNHGTLSTLLASPGRRVDGGAF